MVAMLLAEMARSAPEQGDVADFARGNQLEGSSMETAQLRRFLVNSGNGRKEQLIATRARTVADLKAVLSETTGIPIEEQLLSSTSGFLACEDAELVLPEFSMLHVRVRCLGGKGGFGAMLRGQASRPGMKKVESNTGAMRDLSGRRLRHVEQESKLAEWAKEGEKRKAEKEMEKQAKKQKLYEKTHEAAEQYVADATIDAEEVSSATIQGIQAAKKKAAEAFELEERKKREAIEKAKKLSKMWGDADEGSDASSDAEPTSKKPKPSKAPASAPAPAAAPAPAPAPAAPAAPAPAAAAASSSASGATGEAAAAQAPAASTGAPPVPPEDVDVEAVADVAALEGMGGERLKHALTVRGLKCGGTVQQRAERLWSVRGLPKDKWPAALLAAKPPPKM